MPYNIGDLVVSSKLGRVYRVVETMNQHGGYKVATVRARTDGSLLHTVYDKVGRTCRIDPYWIRSITPEELADLSPEERGSPRELTEHPTSLVSQMRETFHA